MDKEIFTTRVLENEKTFYSIAMSMLKNEKDCEDVVQDTILTAYSKLSSLKNDEYFKTWFIRILINKCKHMLHNRKRSVVISEISEESVDISDVHTEIKLALENLKPKIRIVMVMYYIEDFSIKEIHSVLKIPEGTVKSRLSKGRQLMRLELE
ncbi:MAG: RNA polymerase sigma factor [Acutalibacteraceae bacterium]|nr:RNA polymerase sigma factor [Acutalibacteraceae bacterium]